MKNILVYGHVNLNLIDGSAIWLRSLVETLSATNAFNVHVILKQPVQEELETLPNVAWVDPFEVFPDFEFSEMRLNDAEALRIIERYDNEITRCDYFILRQIDWACFDSWDDNFLKRSYLYNINSLEIFVKKYDRVLRGSAGIIAQTDLMLDQLKIWINDVSDIQFYVMPPMIPDFSGGGQINRNRLVYAGKFTAMWQVKEIANSFSDLRKKIPNIELHVAGDKFDKTVDKKLIISIMENSEGIFWHKRLSRKESLSLIGNCGVGIGWRNPRLKDSIEVSTKFLEYCMQGLPAIVNPITIHKNLLGEDYPLFASNLEEYKEKCILAVTDDDAYKVASKKCKDIIGFYGYRESGKRLVEFLLKN